MSGFEASLVPLLLLLAAYGAGSIPTGLWLGLWLRGVDIREHGSKNIGATNTLRVLGKKLGVVALLCDMAKGFLPVLAVRHYADGAIWPILCGLAAILGHSFSLFLRFRGGKGVATSAGVFLALAPGPILAGAYAFAGVLLYTQMVSAGSVAAALVVAAVAFVSPVPMAARALIVLIAALVIYKHRDNLRRMVRGEESRMWTPPEHRRAAGLAGALFVPGGTDYAVAVWSSLGALAVYVQTLACTVTGEDSGEFIAAALNLGIPHPPGYPLYVMLAHPFTWLPAGNPAWQVALMSAVFSAAAAGVTALLIVLLTGNRLAAAGGAFAFAFSRECWQQATIAEVYGLNAFLFALCLFLLFLWHAWKQLGTERNGLLYALAVVCGMGLAAHNTMVLAAPALAVYVLAVDRAPLRRLSTYLALVVLSLLTTVLLYCYLPVRSLANPVPDWGNPENLANWWDVVRRKQFAFMFTQYPHSLERFARQMWDLAVLWGREFYPVGLLPIAIGWLWLRRNHLWQAVFLLATALLILAGFAFVQNFEHDKQWLWVMSVFGIPACLCTAVFWGAGAVALQNIFKRPAARMAVGGALMLAVLCQIVAFRHENDKSDFHWVRDYGVNVLQSLEPDAIWVSEMDHQSFSAMYLQQAEGVRTDVSLMRTYGYVNLDLVQGMPRERLQEFGEFPRRRHEPEIFAWLLKNNPRPVYFSEIPKLDEMEDVRFVPWGLVYRALRSGESMPEGNPWDQYTWARPLTAAHTHGDYTAELILCEIAMAKAHLAYQKHALDAAREQLDEARVYCGAEPLVLNNLATLSARFQDWPQAAKYLQEALKLAPENPTIQRNMERLQEHLP